MTSLGARVDATTLNCPTCGAAAAPDAVSCGFCRARLATVGCPSCFALVFVGHRHCAACGAEAGRPVVVERVDAPCPRGCGPLARVELRDVPLGECAGCGGVWLDEPTFERLCADRERQSAVLAKDARVSGAVPVLDGVRYVRCPACDKVMNRVNFARVSGVVVDRCRGHGVWFDHDELRRVVEFVRGGGMEIARAREREMLESERQLRARRERLSLPEPRAHHQHREGAGFSADSGADVDLFDFFASLLGD